MTASEPEVDRNAAARRAAKRYRELAPRVPDAGLNLFEVFPETTEIEMEIGFGRGMFLVERGERVPQHGLLGIEIKDKLAVRVAERVQKRAWKHVRVLAGDARTIAASLRPDGVLARVFMHFPDPWWKKRHQKRRLLDGSLLDELARLLRTGGELFVQTDVEDRAETFLAELRQHAAFEIVGDGYTPHNPYGARSNREARAEQDGLPIFRILAHRRARD